jgi:hypothetical protein
MFESKVLGRVISREIGRERIVFYSSLRIHLISNLMLRCARMVLLCLREEGWNWIDTMIGVRRGLERLVGLRNNRLGRGVGLIYLISQVPYLSVPF